MQKNKNKGLLFKTNNARVELLYKNMGKYKMVDDILSPAIGTAYYSHQSDNAKLSKVQKSLLSKTHDDILNSNVYSVKDNNVNNIVFDKENDYINYISNTNGVDTWYDWVRSYLKDGNLTIDSLKTANLFEDAPGVVRYIQPIAASTGKVITTNLNNTDNVDTKLGELSNLFYGRTLNRAAYMNDMRKNNPITPELKGEYGNVVSNLVTLPSLFPMDDEIGRVSSWDNGYNSIFIKEDENIKNNKKNDNENFIDYASIEPNKEFNNKYKFFKSPYMYHNNKDIIPTDKDKLFQEKTRIELYANYTDLINKFKEKDGDKRSLSIDALEEGGKILNYSESGYNENPSADESLPNYSSYFDNDPKFNVNWHNKDLLDKTKYLFNNKKIKTLIDKEKENQEKEEKNVNYKGSKIEGRQWTPSKMYLGNRTGDNTYNGLIRPGSNGFPGLLALQTAKGFFDIENSQYLESNTVLNSNGFVNITPSSRNSSKKIEIKKCMFSIENLAWKDVKADDNLAFPEFEKGPNNGRIMWFPPYNLKFTENVGVRWEPNNFIGRGEPIYTYTNTERSGTLGFTVLIDNPSILEAFKQSEKGIKDDIAYANFFAGVKCPIVPPKEIIRITSGNRNGATQVQTEVVKDGVLDGATTGDGVEDSSVEITETETSTEYHTFSVYYPNGYYGKPNNNDIKDSSDIFKYLMFGVRNTLPQKEENETWENYFTRTNGYEVGKTLGEIIEAENYDDLKNGKIDNIENVGKIALCKSNGFYYEILKSGNEIIARRIKGEKNNFIQYKYDGNPEAKLGAQGQYLDLMNYDFNIKYLGDEGTYSFVDAFMAIENEAYKDAVDVAVKYRKCNKDKINIFLEKIVNNKENIKKIKITSFTSKHGSDEYNSRLAENRNNSVAEWLKNKLQLKDNVEFVYDIVSAEIMDNENSNSINNEAVKGNRQTQVEFEIQVTETITASGDNNNNSSLSPRTVETPKEEAKNNEENTEETPPDEIYSNSNNFDESKFFDIVSKNPNLLNAYTERIKYFSPAFHSITPEGFNSRLTFLHQCTRQGGTMESINGKHSGNLSFGRAPVCVLRVGDFYNTRIIIESLTIDYDNNQWDLNPEGIGVQPMVANVNLTFKFVGGSSLGGAISRLQNALSFNYYANTSAFDYRADRKDASGDYTYNILINNNNNK